MKDVDESTNQLRHLMKKMAWEHAKGALRAFAVIDGSIFGVIPGSTAWETIDNRVEAFIEEIEEDGLHE